MSDVAVVQTINSEKDKKIISKRSLFSWWKNAEAGSGQQEAWRKSKEGVYPCHGGGGLEGKHPKDTKTQQQHLIG